MYVFLDGEKSRTDPIVEEQNSTEQIIDDYSSLHACPLAQLFVICSPASWNLVRHNALEINFVFLKREENRSKQEPGLFFLAGL